MIRRYTYTHEEYEELFGPSKDAREYPAEGEVCWIKEDTPESHANELSGNGANVSTSDGDIPSLIEALEHLQLVQNQEVVSGDESTKETDLYQQLVAEIASLRALLGAVQKESQHHRNCPRFHENAHLSPSMLYPDGDNSSPAISTESTAHKSPRATNKNPAPRRPGSSRLPPHLVAAGFRMCHEEE
ncbi:hypothetical protein BJ138DRAFT_1119005 [Hygrophoropsis aurantiaca]|uniref:Uncharacterized protein n=1 Tax=Hygrophoropsis aurantiaca TaxID=72124 RepID=A0ACB7ZW21_9AGAM|nr:hypothetical protein BJ138DRAFT_1119005 [Hygrophoropsis aurantiaca]